MYKEIHFLEIMTSMMTLTLTYLNLNLNLSTTTTQHRMTTMSHVMTMTMSRRQILFNDCTNVMASESLSHNSKRFIIISNRCRNAEQHFLLFTSNFYPSP